MAGNHLQLPLALYVHLPWCVRKCPYCDFNSHALAGDLPATEYTDALLADLTFALADSDELDAHRRIDSVFFGGGTPSLFPATQLARIIAFLRERGRLAHDAEISLEANPGTIEHGSFAGFAAAGINRVSLGAQSFNSAQLTVPSRWQCSSTLGKAWAKRSRVSAVVAVEGGLSINMGPC